MSVPSRTRSAAPSLAGGSLRALPPTPGSGGLAVATQAAAIGALVGGTGALATHRKALTSPGPERGSALRAILRETGKTGLATGLGALVAHSLRGGPLVSAVSMVATGAAVLAVLEPRSPTAASGDAPVAPNTKTDPTEASPPR